MTQVFGQTFDRERALYAAHDEHIENCRFEGPADGESALKEAHDLTVSGSYFALRYPFWHNRSVCVTACEMTPTCRAAVWYAQDMTFNKCKMNGIKAVRECDGVRLLDCDAVSPEFGWFSHHIDVRGGSLSSEYAFMHSDHITVDGWQFTGKYSFQYVSDVTIRNANLDTKDAFWHAKRVTVYDSVIKGEYLAWYAQDIKFVRCTIIGTQPLCYTDGVTLEDCKMQQCDLSFEYSTVHARLCEPIDSVKNPHHGLIEAPAIGEIILDENIRPDSDCRIVTG